MLSVIWTILKIILIIILILIAVLLIVCLIVLFAPVTYHGNTAYKDRFKSDNKITWLWIIASLSCGYDKAAYAKGRILWFKFDLLDKDEEDEYDESEEHKDIEEASDTEPVTHETSNNTSSDDMTQETEANDKDDTKNSDNGKKSEKKKRSLASILKQKKDEFLDKLRNINKKKESILTFIHDKNNIRLWNLLKNSIKKLFKHILPRRCTGNIIYGFDDPYYTGKLLSYISLMPWAYSKHMTIIPVFDKQVIDGEIRYKGHIQIGVILFILLRVWFDKDFKRVYNLYKNR